MNKLAAKAKASLQVQLNRLNKKVASVQLQLASLNTLAAPVAIRDENTRVYTWDNVGDAIINALCVAGVTSNSNKAMTVEQVVDAVVALPNDYTYTAGTIKQALMQYHGKMNKDGWCFLSIKRKSETSGHTKHLYWAFNPSAK